MSKLDNYVKLNSYQDKSIVCVIPTRGMVDIRVIDSWFKLITPVNHKFTKLFMTGGNIDDAYNTAITGIIHHPELSKYRFILTMEDDNLPPPDGILKLVDTFLHQELEDDKYWALSGLYWTKPSRDTIEHAPIAFGCPDLGEWNMFTPPLEEDGSVTQCCLIPQGFTLYDMDIFKKHLTYPWFKTIEKYDSTLPELDQTVGSTQDDYFFKNMWAKGLKVGVRADIKVGHLDSNTNQIW